MNKNIRVIGLALVAVVALLVPMNASAICGSAISFGSYYSFVTNTSGTPSLRSNFWLLNAGNTAAGAGIDNGTVAESDVWLVQYPDTAHLAVLSTWAAQAYDGCPDSAAGGPPTGHRMVLSFSDVNGAGNMTYAVACAHRDTQAGVQFDFTQPSNAPIALVQAPKGSITNTVRAGTDATVTVASPDFSAGFYGDGSVGCEAATVIPQYDVYKQQLARGGVAASSRDVTSWTLVGTGNTGTPFVFNTGCGATNCDIVLAVTPHYNSGFGTGEAATGGAARVGQNSGTIQAGPTLAVTPKAKVITNRKASE